MHWKADALPVLRREGPLEYTWRSSYRRLFGRRVYTSGPTRLFRQQQGFSKRRACP